MIFLLIPCGFEADMASLSVCATFTISVHAKTHSVVPPTPEQQENPQQLERKRKFPVTIQYMKGMSEELRRVFSKFGIPAYFKPTNILRQLLVRPKDPIEKEKVVGLVSKITCED